MEKNIKIKPCKKIMTFNQGRPNGWVLEILSEHDKLADAMAGQVYLSVAAPGAFKGYHIHAAADYYVTCIKGKVRDVIYQSKDDRKEIQMDGESPVTVFVPKGAAHGFENIGEEEAFILIYRFPAWSPDLPEQLDILPEEIESEDSWQKIKNFVNSFNN